jgi:hypothetical protein
MGDVWLISPSGKEVAIEDYSEHQIEYHLSLLRDICYIDCPGSQPMLGITFSGLTWEGHYFLDAIRDPGIWGETKKSTEAIGSFTMDLVKEVAKAFIKKQLADYTGLTF